MTIAAVVVTYNRIDSLKRSIKALRKQSHTPNEIIVINNSSTDGSLDWRVILLLTIKDVCIFL